MPAPLPDLDLIFGALSDPTRRYLLDQLATYGTGSVPSMWGEINISRQGLAKHLQVLDRAGLIERTEESGHPVEYRLAPSALLPIIEWLNDADEAWSGRLDRLKAAAESRG